MATGVEIANAYVSLYTKMPGVSKDISKALGGSDVQNVVRNSGSSMGAALAGAVGGAVAAVTSKAIGTVMSSINGAIKRVDIMNNFPKIMKNLGYSADDAEKSITKMSDKLKGLPTTLDGMAGAVQQLAPLTGSLDKATDLSLALNNALLAGGKATDLQANAMEQYVQMLSIGKVDMAAWRSMVSAMPGQMDQLSKSLLGANAKQTDLYEALKDGTLSFEDFNSAVLKLNDEGLTGYASFAAQAKDATDGIATAQAGLSTAVTRGLAKLIDKFQPQIVSGFNLMSDAVNGAFTAIGNVVDWLSDKAVGPLMEEISGGIDAMVAGFKNAEDGMTTTGLAGVLESIGVAAGRIVDSGLLTYLSPLGAVFQILEPVLPTIAEAVTDIAISFALLMGELGPVLSSALEKLVPMLMDVVVGFVDAVVEFTPLLVDFLDSAAKWAGENIDWLVALGIAIGAAVLAWKGWALVVGTWKTVTAAATAVQAGFNLVMNANPIMLVVTAIAGLVAGLVFFFTQTETGKQIWEGFMQFLGDAWTNISGFFTEAYENVIAPVFNAIAEVATWLWETILKPVFDAVSNAVQFVAGAIKLAFDLIVNYFRFWGAVAVWLWDVAIKPALDAIGAAFKWLWDVAIKPAIDAIGAAFKWLYDNAVKPVADWISGALESLGSTFEWLNDNVVQPVWSAIESALKAGWNWIDTNVFTPFKNGIDLIAKGFETAKKAIETTWDGIKKAAAVPINFVLDTVWNKGLRSFWNDIVGTLGLEDMKLPEATLVKFASGGVLPGYTPGQDVHQFYSATGGRLALSGGEAIMRPEFTKAVGGKAGVDRLNRAARNGQSLGFSDGGVFGFFEDAWNNVTNAFSIAGDFLTDPLGAINKHIVEGIIQPLLGDGDTVFLKAIGQLPINLVRGLADKFFGGSLGSPGMGWESMWNIVQGAVPGAVMTSNYRPGSTTVNGGQSYHGSGRAIDIVPATMDIFNAVKRLFPNATELIYTPAGSAQLSNGRPYAGWSQAVQDQHWDHIHLAMAQGGVVPKLYDQGGWLPHGGLGLNMTGRPEAVLTPDESDALKRGLRGGDSLRLVVDGHEFAAFVDDRADAVASSKFGSPQSYQSEFAR